MSTRRESEHKVIRKIEALEAYAASKEAKFKMPAKGRFSFNWFCEFTDNDQGFEKISKSLSLVRSKERLRVRADLALRQAQETYEGIRNLDVDQSAKAEKLQLENRELKSRIARLAQDVLELMEENETLNARLGVQQAQWRDKHRIKQWAEADPDG